MKILNPLLSSLFLWIGCKLLECSVCLIHFYVPTSSRAAYKCLINVWFLTEGLGECNNGQMYPIMFIEIMLVFTVYKISDLDKVSLYLIHFVCKR